MFHNALKAATDKDVERSETGEGVFLGFDMKSAHLIKRKAMFAIVSYQR